MKRWITIFILVCCFNIGNYIFHENNCIALAADETIKLSIGERLQVRALLPESGTMVEQLVARDLLKKIELSQDEIKQADLKIEDKQVKWKNQFDKEFTFTDSELSTIRTQITKLDNERKITLELLGLCEKFQKVKKDEPEKK